MLKITAKDRVFAAVAAPVCVAAAYALLVRAPLSDRVRAMEGAISSLGSPDALSLERTALRRRLDDARLAREAAESELAPVPVADAAGAAPAAERIRRVTEVFETTPGVHIRASTPISRASAANAGSPAAALKEGAGIDGPAVRRFSIVAQYPALLAALEKLSQSRPAVVTGVRMDASRGRTAEWAIDICL
ncbi:MAG: hypothetical protein IJS46_02635 [Kiritimatiellae bacterium]|nr:hypothetical protein [Kiritimatiellia bacterium]